LTTNLVIPKDIATKSGEYRSKTQLYHCANFHANRHRRRRDSPSYTKIQTYPDDIYDKTHTGICVCRIIDSIINSKICKVRRYMYALTCTSRLHHSVIPCTLLLCLPAILNLIRHLKYKIMFMFRHTLSGYYYYYYYYYCRYRYCFIIVFCSS